jgi:hypothetical protein
LVWKLKVIKYEGCKTGNKKIFLVANNILLKKTLMKIKAGMKTKSK